MLRSAPNGLYFNLYYTFFNKTINFLKLAIMKTLFITALLAITVASCNQKVKEVEAAETTATANELYACSMHPTRSMSGMWYGTNRESGAATEKRTPIMPMKKKQKCSVKH
jgi:hypothetical protein